MAYDIFPQITPTEDMERVTEEKMARLVGYIQDLRDDGELPMALAFPRIALALTWLAETRVMASHRDGDLAQISERIEAVEREHGLGVKDFWSNGDGPPEWQAFIDQYSRVVAEITAEFMREHGEDEMAELMLADRERFDRLCTPGRRQRCDA